LFYHKKTSLNFVQAGQFIISIHRYFVSNPFYYSSGPARANAIRPTQSTASGLSQHPFTVGLDQIQIHQSAQVVSKSEADEISRRLVELKSLALATKDEQCTQSEKLDELIPTVDTANVRLMKLDKKAKHLT